MSGYIEVDSFGSRQPGYESVKDNEHHVKGVIVLPGRRPPATFHWGHIYTTELEQSDLEGNRWLESQVTKLFGIPVKALALAKNSSKKENSAIFNHTIEYFFTDTDVMSPGFGQPLNYPKLNGYLGEFILMRSDGKDLPGELFSCVTSFISREWTTMKKKDIPCMMSPDAFATFFKRHDHVVRAMIGSKWKALECPVQAGPYAGRIICVRCCKTTGPAGETLRLCGRCKFVQYCSKSCQRENWVQHKKACKLLAAGVDGKD